MLPRNFRPCGKQRTLCVCRQGREACLWPTRCTPLGLGYKGSEWGSKLGFLDSEMQYVDETVWRCGLGTFDLVGCNGLCHHVGLELLGVPRFFA